MSEFVNTTPIAREILDLAELVCATGATEGDEPASLATDFKPVIVGNRIQATVGLPGTDMLVKFQVPKEAYYVLTWFYLRSLPTPALTAGAFNPLSPDNRSNQDLGPTNSQVPGGGVPALIFNVDGVNSFSGGSNGIMPQLVCNRPVLIVFQPGQKVVIFVRMNAPAAPTIDLIAVLNMYSVPIRIGKCFNNFNQVISAVGSDY